MHNSVNNIYAYILLVCLSFLMINIVVGTKIVKFYMFMKIILKIFNKNNFLIKTDFLFNVYIYER